MFEVATIYALKCEQFVKLGFSTQFDERLAQIRRANPFPIDVLYTMPGTLEDEAELLEGAREWRTDGYGREWHHADPGLLDYVRDYFSGSALGIKTCL